MSKVTLDYDDAAIETGNVLAAALGLSASSLQRVKEKTATRLVADNERVFEWKANNSFNTSRSEITFFTVAEIAAASGLSLQKVKSALRSGGLSTNSGKYVATLKSNWQFLDAEDN
jgi:hypothetical protein